MVYNKTNWAGQHATQVQPTKAGKLPAIFFARRFILQKLSIFVDESGDFGEYQPHSPYYIVTMVIHEQEKSISENIEKLNSFFPYKTRF